MSTSVTIDGRNTPTLEAFLRVLGEALRAACGSDDAYFGRNLDAFHDCLHGGFIGSAPYHITVVNAEWLGEGWSHEAYANYLVRRLARLRAQHDPLPSQLAWFEDAIAKAQRSEGEDLLGATRQTIEHANGTLRLVVGPV